MKVKAKVVPAKVLLINCPIVSIEHERAEGEGGTPRSFSITVNASQGVVPMKQARKRYALLILVPLLEI